MPEPEPQSPLPIILVVLFTMDAVVVGTIVTSQSSATIGLAAGAAALLLPTIAIPVTVAILNRISGWSRLAATYPVQPIAEDARRGDAESLGLRRRWLTYNGCVRWAADDRHIHLKIIPFFGYLSRPMSIPWTEIDFDESAAPVGRLSPLVPLETAAGIKLFVPPGAVETERDRRLSAPGVADSAAVAAHTHGPCPATQ